MAMNWNTTKRSVAALAALLTIVALGPAALAGDEQPCEPAWHSFESGGQIGVTNQSGRRSTPSRLDMP
jgi:cytochrome oxidase Cu insertion factor (SCO1/SenC/PrrC family)